MKCRCPELIGESGYGYDELREKMCRKHRERFEEMVGELPDA